MKLKILIAIGFAIVAAVIVYTGTSRPDNPPSPTEMLAQVAKLKQRACACKDVACANQVGDDVTAFVQRIRYAPNPSKDEMQQLKDAANETSSCLERVVKGTSGSGSGTGSATEPAPAH